MWEKILLNLLSNAFKFTFDGEIRVAVRSAAAHVELIVEDTGIGIAADDLPHIFARFHRVKDARSRTHEGTGIGLALVQELVRLHGGDVAVTSEPGPRDALRGVRPQGHGPPARRAHRRGPHAGLDGRRRGAARRGGFPVAPRRHRAGRRVAGRARGGHP